MPSGCPFAALGSILPTTSDAGEAAAAPDGEPRRGALRPRRWLLGGNPFAGGTLLPSRVPVFEAGRPSLPFPHPWNYRAPLDILAAYYWSAHEVEGFAQHNRYFDVPGLPLGLVTRDPRVIRAVLLATGDKPGQFHRDTAPTEGIARATGADTMLYSNGPFWRKQKKLASRAFSRRSLFRDDKFHEFEATFRATVTKRVESLARSQADRGEPSSRVQLDREIEVIMMEMLARNFFGAEVTHQELRERYVPAVTGLIRHMVRNTVGHQYLEPMRRWLGGGKRARAWARDFETLVDLCLEGRKRRAASWADFDADVPEDALRSNLRVFLAGALEATTSLASWTLVHLSRRPDLQEKIFAEIGQMESYTPENLERAQTLRDVIEETLRLTPALYFLPRYAGRDVQLEVEGAGTLRIPRRTHVVLDVWHANRTEEFWGQEKTGYRADVFAPERWAVMRERGTPAHERLHFGFGHGARVCPGQFLGILEVSLVVGAFVRLFRFGPVGEQAPARAAVSTKPGDGAMLELLRR